MRRKSFSLYQQYRDENHSQKERSKMERKMCLYNKYEIREKKKKKELKSVELYCDYFSFCFSFLFFHCNCNLICFYNGSTTMNMDKSYYCNIEQQSC